MKNIIIAFNILLFSSQIFAQCNIPNPDFENWSGSLPTSWNPIHPSDTSAIFKTSDSYSGNYAVKFDTASSFIGLKSSFACTERPANLQGYYKMTGDDSLVVYVTLTDASINTIASGVGVMIAPYPDYTKFNVFLEYDTTANPVYGFVNIISAGHGTIYVDDLSFNGTILTPVTDSIPMRDFKKLAADIYLPNTIDTFPTILIQTPYNRKAYHSIGLPLNVDFDITSSNYAFVIADWRCFYGSTSACVPNVTLQKRGEDGYDIIEWIIQQPWSDGQVGTYGGSALGKVQYYTAREQHPAHICAVPKVTGTATNYATYFCGGALKVEYLETLDVLGYGTSALILGIDSIRFYNNYWQYAEDVGFFPEMIKTKMFLIGGWYDHNIEDVIQLYDSLRVYSDPSVRDKHRLLFGPWTHGGYTTAGVGDPIQGEINYYEAENYDDSLALLFLDYYLRNQNNGWDNFPDIKYFQMGENNWYNTINWPPDSINDVTFYLHADATIDNNMPVNTTDELSYLYNPSEPSPTWGGSTLRFDLLQGPYDQSYMVENRSDILIFSTPVLTQDVVMKGNVKINLYVSSDRYDTDFAVRLTDVYPDERSIILSNGIQRMRFRNGYRVTDTAMMIPCQVYPITIELPNTAITFLAGHKIRIDVTSSNYPKYNRNMNTGGNMYPNHNGDTLINPLIATNTVYLNSVYPSNIILPLKDYSAGIKKNESDNNKINDILIYPNPTTGIFTIKGKNIQSIEITNISGQVIYVKNPQGFENLAGLIEVDLSEQPKGVCFVKIHTNNFIKVKKLIIN